MFTFIPSGNDQFLNERGLKCLTLAPNGVGISYSISFMPLVRLQTGCCSRPTPPILLFFPFGSGESLIKLMVKFASVLSMLFISGFLSAQVYTLKTDPDAEKYTEAIDVLSELIDLNSDDDVKKFLIKKGYSEYYIDVINNFKNLVNQCENRGHLLKNKENEKIRSLRMSSSKYSPYKASLIFYKNNSTCYRTLLRTEKGDFLPLNNLENEILLKLLELVTTGENFSSSFYHFCSSVHITNEIKNRISLDKFSVSETNIFKDLTKNETVINFNNPTSNIDAKNFKKAVEILWSIRYEDEITSLTYLKSNGFQTDNLINTINNLIEIVKIGNANKLDENYKKDSEWDKKNRDLGSSQLSNYIVRINGILLNYERLFAQDAKIEILNSLNLDIEDLKSLKVITQKDGQEKLTKILDELIEKKKNKILKENPSTSVITTNNASSNQESDTKTIVYTNGVFWGLAVNDKKEGFGIMELNDGSLYEGNFSNDLKNGYGVSNSANGDRYEGDWFDGKRHGQGTYYYNNGDRFVGQFSNNQRTEQGTYSNGVDKKGCVNGDCNNGFGKKVFTNGVYEGDFVNGKENGKGKMTHPNKSVYDGDWKDGKKQGKGKYTWYSGSSYDGDWKDGKKQGKGLYIWGKGNSEGDKYEGDWYEDERTGWGVYTSKNGTIQEGNFEKGIYKGKELLRAVNSNNSPTNNVQHNSVDQSSAQVCNIKFLKPSGLVVEYNDNRKVCCYCEIKYAKHSLDPNQKLWDEAKYLSENLYLHFSEVKATDQHMAEDIKKLSEFINSTYKDPFMTLIPELVISTIPANLMVGALTGKKGEIGSKLRYIDQYKIASKFCSNECETKCEYYGCKTCK